MSTLAIDGYYKKLNENVCWIRNTVIPYSRIKYLEKDDDYRPTIKIYLEGKGCVHISFQNADTEKKYKLFNKVFEEITNDAWPSKQKSEETELSTMKAHLVSLQKELEEVRKLLNERNPTSETEDLLNIENNIVINGTTLGATSLD